MKITEMEGYHDAFTELEDKIRVMLEKREFPEIFNVCVESFPSIIPSIQYRKKRNIEPEMPDLLAFEVICKYAPPLFEHFALTSLFDFVKSTRQLARHENAYLEKIKLALADEEISRLLWIKLENNPNSSQLDICGGIDASLSTLVEILKLWEELGVIFRHNENEINKFSFTSRSNIEMEGICPNCGVRGKGLKEAFFKMLTCQKCGANDYYHIII